VAKGRLTESGGALEWTCHNTQNEPLRYVVYRFVDHEAINLDRNDRIINIGTATRYLDGDVHKYKHVQYVVTALDRTWNESKMSNVVAVGE
jgi:fibronectin type 3 domain-containing protein